MKNFLPGFIQEKYKSGELGGELEAPVLSIDLVGFTKISDVLIEKGKEGAEFLSEIINLVFTPGIKAVYSSGGFITGFSGDSFTALFPDTAPIYAVEAALDILSGFKNTRFKIGDKIYPLKVKIGLAYGKIDWKIISSDFGKTYLFAGKGILEACNAQKACAQNKVFMDKSIYKMVSSNIKTFISGKYFILEEIILRSGQKKETKTVRLSKDFIREFFPEELFGSRYLNEFRKVTSLFISFKGDENLEQMTKSILELTKNYGGFLNKIEYGDKGYLALILFGAPKAVEKPVYKALSLAEELCSKFPKQKLHAGLSFGTVFAGEVGSEIRNEYSVLGSLVNLSARLMTMGKPGEIITEINSFKSAEQDCDFEETGNIRIKGFRSKVKIYKLTGTKKEDSLEFTGTLIGRKGDLTRLNSFCKPLETFKFGGIVYIDGTAGIGKSRLVFEFKESLEKSEYNFFILPCDEIFKHSLNPVISFLKDYFQFTEDMDELKKKDAIENKIKQLYKSINDEDIKKELFRSMPFLGFLLNVKWKKSIIDLLSSKEKHDNILIALKNLIKAESLVRKTILVFEDVHWIDPDTVEFINSLLRNVDSFPFILLIISRLNDDNSVLRLPVECKIINSLFLEHLGEDESLNMLRTLLNSEISPDLFKAVWDKSKGNPFFIEQMTLYLKETEGLEKNKEGKLELKMGEIEIPDRIANIIIARIDRLENKLKQVIKTAAVLGTEIPILVLSKMLRENKNIKNSIREIEKEGIWIPLSELMYLFKHVIIRDTVYEMQMKKRLKELHLLAGESIEKVYRKQIKSYYGTIAFHFEKGENIKKAKEYLLKAGDHAMGNYKNHEAVNYYERLLKYLSNPKEKLEIYMALGNACHIINNLNKAEEYFILTCKCASQIKDEIHYTESIINLARIKWLKLQYSKSLRLLDKGMKLAKKLNLAIFQSEVLNHRGTINFYLGNLDKAMKFYKECLEIIKDTKDYVKISGAYDNIAFIYSEKGDYLNALKHYKLSEKFGKFINNKFFMKSNSHSLGNLYSNLAMYEKALKYYKKELKLATEMGDLHYVYLGNLGVGFCYLYLGKYEQAMEFIEKTLALSREQYGMLGLIYALMYKGDIYLCQGNLKETHAPYKEALDISRKYGNKRGIAACLMRFANFFNLDGKTQKSISTFKKAIKVFTEIGMDPQVISCKINLASILIKSRKFKSAVQFLNEAQKTAETIKRKDLILKTEIHLAYITGIKKPEDGVKLLNSIQKQTADQDEIAQISLYRYLITKKKTHKTKAIKAYRDLYRKIPRFQYLKTIKQLSSK
ncbi:MAG TPA: tetratricopeptide repeat protein [Firmicutes bacterium]|nr:tetratricopeptide repeat protein [Bacillota bacterium]